MVYGVIMRRTQIILDDWNYESLKSYAERQGRSMSDVVREAVTAYMSKNTKAGRSKSGLRAIEGIFCDGGDAARNHDFYLYGLPKKARHR